MVEVKTRKSIIKRHKRLRQYDVFCVGVTKKLEKKASLEARDQEEAHRKAERFAKMAGLKFSHIQAQ